LEEDIPEVEIIDQKKILIGGVKYDLIMCYLCPICKKPIIAYWKVPEENNRTTPNIIGRALRDSGFGGFRFFSTERGQGFEYDWEKDPRKRHQHGKKKQYYYGSGDEYEELWALFIKLNPIFSINDFLNRILDPHDTEFPKDFQFISTQTLTESFFNEMQKRVDAFKISSDMRNHGKDLFYFNIVYWEQMTKYGVYELSDRIDKLREWFGDDLIRRLDFNGKYQFPEPQAERYEDGPGSELFRSNPKSSDEINQYASEFLDAMDLEIKQGNMKSARRILWRALGALESMKPQEINQDVKERFNQAGEFLERSKAFPKL